MLSLRSRIAASFMLLSLTLYGCGGGGSHGAAVPVSPMASPTSGASTASVARISLAAPVTKIDAVTHLKMVTYAIIGGASGLSGEVEGTSGVVCDTDIGLVCSGPNGSTATIIYETAAPTFPLAVASCTGPIFSYGNNVAAVKRAAAGSRRPMDGGGGCGPGYNAFSVTAPDYAGGWATASMYGVYEVCFKNLPNPCGETTTGTAELGISSTGAAPGSTEPGSPGSGGGSGGGGGGTPCSDGSSSISHNSAMNVVKPYTGVGTGGSPPPIATPSPTPSPSCTDAPVTEDNTFKIDIPQYNYDGSTPYPFDEEYGSPDGGDTVTSAKKADNDAIRAAESGTRQIATASVCTGEEKADGSTDGNLALNATVTCTGSAVPKTVVFYVFTYDPNDTTPRATKEYKSKCGGGSTCTIDQINHPVNKTSIIQVATYFSDTKGTSGTASMEMPYNEQGQLYPLFHAPGYMGNDAQVPFPEMQFTACRKNTNVPPCYARAVDFKQLLTGYYNSLGWDIPFQTPPGPGGVVPKEVEAHHIKPISWGGDNSMTNGVFLLHADHVVFTKWWNKFKVNGVTDPNPGGD